MFIQHMMKHFVRVSSQNSRYFEFHDGHTFIPIGVNLCFERLLEADNEILASYEKYFKIFSENGGKVQRYGVPHRPELLSKSGGCRRHRARRADKIIHC